MPTSIPSSKREETEPDETVLDEIYRHELLADSQSGIVRLTPRPAAVLEATAPLQTVRKATIVRTVTHQPGRKTLKKTPLKLVAPTTVSRTVTPRRRPNAELRTHEHLTEASSATRYVISYFWALEKAVSSTSPIGCHVRPSN